MTATPMDKPRPSLGEDFSRLPCLSCGLPTMHVMLDRRGRPYSTCSECRVRTLGMSLRAAASLRFFARLLADPRVREKWAAEVADCERQRLAAPPPEVATPSSTEAARAAASTPEVTQ